MDGRKLPDKAICIVTHNIEEAVLLVERAGFFLDLLRHGFSADDARRQLDIAIDWGRYGELYDYDSLSDGITADPAAGIHPGPSSTTRAPRDPLTASGCAGT
jgi:hypothetical protein